MDHLIVRLAEVPVDCTLGTLFFKILLYDILISLIKEVLATQKQPLEVFCGKTFSYKIQKFHKKTPMLESLFNKVAGLRPATSLKRSSNTAVFPEIRESFKNTYFKK